MYLNSIYKLEKIVDPDGTEGQRYIHIGERTATATDGKCVAVVPCVVGPNDVQGPVTPDAVEYARKHGLSPMVVLHLVNDSSVLAEDSTEFPRSYGSFARQKDGEQLELFRKAADVKPVNGLSVVPTADESDVRLKVNAKRLWDLAQALGCDKEKPLALRLKPDAEGRVRLIVATGVDGATGAMTTFE